MGILFYYEYMHVNLRTSNLLETYMLALKYRQNILHPSSNIKATETLSQVKKIIKKKKGLVYTFQRLHGFLFSTYSERRGL